MRRKKVNWQAGDVFIIPLNNGKVSIGQTLGQSLPTSVRIALYDEIYKTEELPSG